MEGLHPYLIPVIISNVFFVVCLVLAAKRPMWARFVLALVFLGAAAFNSYTAVFTPGAYGEFAKAAAAPLYRFIIEKYLVYHVAAFILPIAAGQFLIFMGLVLNKNWTRLACIGGIIFGFAIAPLGIGSAFPSTIIMAIAFYVLLNKGPHGYIWQLHQYKLNQVG